MFKQGKLQTLKYGLRRATKPSIACLTRQSTGIKNLWRFCAVALKLHFSTKSPQVFHPVIAALGTIRDMSENYRCPKCSSELGTSGGQYSCWNSSCDFRSYRPWITPPERKEEVDISKELEEVIGNCLRASAKGPFFVDRGAKDNPYWEYQTLLGFGPEEVLEISRQWPNVDILDEHVSELISSCFANLLGYPHGCEKHWAEYFSVSKEQLIEYANLWRNSKYV